MKQDFITRIETTLTPDGQGGWIEETKETGTFAVKLSIGSNVEEATAYGVSVEQVLKVIADFPLLEDESSLYIIKGADGKDGKDGSITFEELTDEQKEELRGPQGIQGETGPAGPQGEPGKDGKDASFPPGGRIGDILVKSGGSNLNWLPAEQAVPYPNLPGGTTGQVLTKMSDEDLDYKWQDPQGGSGESGTPIPGPKGDKGEKGEDGFSPTVMLTPVDGGVEITVVDAEGSESYTVLNGKDGAKGDKGEQGEQGIQGEVGPAGPQGIQGEKGETGADGAQGPAGPQGEQGIQGEKGAKGDKGDTYTVTAADYSAIADVVLSKMTNAEGVRY